MKNVIIVFERPDIPTASLLQTKLDAAEVWVFDPHLLDDLALAKVRNSKYINCDAKFDIPSFVAGTKSEALAVERAIEKQIQSTSEAIKLKYWQHLSWVFLQGTLQGYSRLWDSFLSTPFTDTHFHVPLCDKPSSYYLPSFLPAVMLMERMGPRGIIFTAYSHSAIGAAPRFLPVSFGAHRHAIHDVFVHIPTCIYDPGYYESELLASGRSILNFESQNWNVPMAAFDQAPLVHDSEVLQTLDDSEQTQIAQYSNTIESWLTNYFQRYVHTEIYAVRQAKYIVDQYRAQLIFLDYLESEFAHRCPKKIVLSNHDAGLHGPFLAFAKKHAIHVVMLPHAKIFNFSVPSTYDNIVAPTHAIQGGFVSTIEGKRLSAPTLGFPEVLTHSYREPKKLTSIGLILNKFSSDGMSLVDTDAYLNGLREILDWCKTHDVELKIRVKPGGTCVLWLAHNLNLVAENLLKHIEGPIVAFAQRTDLCLMYDAPTSGAAELLRSAVPLLAVLPRDLCPEESRIVNDDLVPQISLVATITRLDEFAQDPVNLFIFRNEQFRRYVDLAGRGVPLRTLF